MAPLNPLQAWIPALKRQREVQYKSWLKKYRFKLKSSYLFFSSFFVLFLSDDKILKKRVTCVHPSTISSPIHCSERTLCCLNITVVVIDITDLPNKANIHRRKDRNVMFFLVFFLCSEQMGSGPAYASMSAEELFHNRSIFCLSIPFWGANFF